MNFDKTKIFKYNNAYLITFSTMNEKHELKRSTVNKNLLAKSEMYFKGRVKGSLFQIFYKLWLVYVSLLSVCTWNQASVKMG
jgi:hypothetical protein